MIEGMTLRDYFAVHASDHDVAEQLRKVPKMEQIRDNGNGTKSIIYGPPVDQIQRARYAHADLMLKVREK